MKRRRFSPDFKLQCVLDVLSGRKTPVQLCRQHSLSETSLSRWKQQFSQAAPKIFEQASPVASAESARIAELERLVGRLTLELEASKKVSEYFHCP